MAGDPFAQRPDTERLGIRETPQRERRLRSGNGRCRSRRGGLADFHVNDAPACRLDARRRRQHVHHHEGWNITALRGREQASCSTQHQLAL